MAELEELYQELYDKARKIDGDAHSLYESLTEDNEADINDWKNIGIISRETTHFKILLEIYTSILNANFKLCRLNDIVQGYIEDGDSVLNIQKVIYSARNNLKEASDVVEATAKGILRIAKTARMNDHRCQRFTARMEDYFELALESMKKINDEMFDIEDED